MVVRPRFTTAVIAIGDEHRHDDGLPFAVVAHIAQRRSGRPAPPRTTLASSVPDAGRLIRLWDGMDLAVVVTVRSAPFGQPLRVHRLEATAEDLARSAPTESVRTRRPGLDEALALARALGRLPKRMVVFAIEGVGPEPGDEPSEQFSGIVTELADRVEREIRRDHERYQRLGGPAPGLSSDEAEDGPRHGTSPAG